MNFKELGEKLGLDEDEYRELVELFLDTGLSDFNNLKDALEAGDAAQVAKSAHTMNGASGNLGILDVHEVAKKIEMAANAGQLEGLSQEVDTLKDLFDKIDAFVNA